MENEIVVPARPWTDADVAFLTRNAGFLPDDVRDELGLTPPVVDEDFTADFDAGKEVIAPEVETGEVEPAGAVEVEITEPTTEEPTVLPTDVDGAVVNNEGTDNA